MNQKTQVTNLADLYIYVKCLCAMCQHVNKKNEFKRRWLNLALLHHSAMMYDVMNNMSIFLLN